MINIKVKDNISQYIFSLIAIAILLGSLTIYNLFKQASNTIKNENLKEKIEYIVDITTNISDLVLNATSKEIYSSLENNEELRDSLERNLQMLISNQYKYIYIIDKKKPNSQEFRFLLDGSKDIGEKSDFCEEYTPLNIKIWNNIYKTKKSIYFENKDAKSVWLTYLKPIVINDKVEAIIAVDFSLKSYSTIVSSLKSLKDAFEISIEFAIVIFIFIIIFSFIDKKRIDELKNKSKEIQNFNNTLQNKVDDEVEKNRKKDQQLFQQSRLAQMGEMISMIAHQWRQPLAAISSTSGAITLKAKLNKLDNEKAIELSTRVSQYSQHLSSTIDDFREFFKTNKEKKETTYDELIESVLGIVEVSITNKNINIIKQLKSKDIFNTYPNELKQVILNLIKNAEDVLLEKEIKNPTITITTKDNILSISDNGGGVPEDILNKIFNPYFSTKTKKDGTGLGLYMSKTIIEEHCGGSLSVTNSVIIDQDGKPSSGAVFTVKLGANND